MTKYTAVIVMLIIISCNSQDISNRETVTVSIPPFRYFTEAISGGDFDINVMVPAGSDPHIYEPSPSQISALRKSSAYISDGYLAFEITWLDRFFEVNRTMKILTLGEKTDLIESNEHQDGNEHDGVDPHFWVSPKSAMAIASSVKSLLCELRPERTDFYEQNYRLLADTIRMLDKRADELLRGFENGYFMIFHPTLGYIARDYGLTQVSVEEDGKEPTPSGMKDLIDLVKEKNIKTIFVMQEFDRKNALTIASETGASIATINPLSEDWPGAVRQIINSLHSSLLESNK